MSENSFLFKRSGVRIFILILFTVLVISCTRKVENDSTVSFRNVLMVGNSHTSAYDLPSQVEYLAADLGAKPGILAVGAAPPDVGLIYHTSPEYSETLGLIQSGRFDIVVVQGGITEACKDPIRFKQCVRELAGEVNKAGAELILFEIWSPDPDGYTPRERSLYEKDWSGGSQKALQAITRSVYFQAASETDAKVAWVGDAWEIAGERYPDMELYRPDGGHPSEHGSYLAACVIVQAITSLDPQSAKWKPDALSRKEAALLRAVAYEVGSDYSPIL